MAYSVSPRVSLRQLRAEAERKREHADADAPGREEVTELVDEDQHAEHEQKRQDCRHTNLRLQF